MAKVQDFNTYVDSQFGSKSNNSHIKEGLMDSLANAIDSIMPFSKTKTVKKTIFWNTKKKCYRLNMIT